MQTETSNTETAAPEIDDERLLALAKHLGEEAADLFDEGNNLYSYGRQEYLVLTDEEADEIALERASETLWAFNTSHLQKYIAALRIGRAAVAFDKMRETLCEDANDLVDALLGDRRDECLKDAISADGRAHYLNTYDGDEAEVTVNGSYYYIFRMD